MRVRFAVVMAVLISTFAASPAAAQSSVASVQLSATVLPYATAERASAPVLRSVSEGVAEYSMSLEVQANTSYRIVARRGAAAGAATLVRTADGAREPLRGSGEVVVARGERGRSTLELSFWVPAGGASPATGIEPPELTIVIESGRQAPRY